MFVHRIHRIWPGWVGRGRQSKMLSGDLHNVRSMSSAGSFCMISVQRPAVDCIYCVIYISTFINRVCMNSQLGVGGIYCFQGRIYYSVSGTPIFMIFKPTCSSFYLFHLGCQRRMRIVTLAQESPVHWYVFYCLHHSAYVEYSWCTSRSISAVCWTYSSSNHFTYYVAYTIQVLLGRYHMNMSIKVPWCANCMLSGSCFGASRYNHIVANFIHYVGVSCIAYPSDFAILYTNISFDNT